MNILKILIILIIKIYQRLISPFLGKNCRFYPSCSQYLAEVVEKKGIFNGFFLFGKRIFRCHPFSEGGYDPIR